MTVASKTSKPHLIEYLPAIYQEADPSRPTTFLGQFLLAFEQVLLGLETEVAGAAKAIDARAGNAKPNDAKAGDAGAKNAKIGNAKIGDARIEGLGAKIAGLHRIFDPRETPEEFLPWLAGWAALSLRSDLSLARKRRLLANIIPLYRIRGTRKYLEELLMLCLDVSVAVSDIDVPALQIGTHSTIGSDTYIDGGPPFFFRVMMVAPGMNESELEAQRQIANDVIELAKPAHTYYEIETVSPGLQLGVHSTVGVDAVLGTATA